MIRLQESCVYAHYSCCHPLSSSVHSNAASGTGGSIDFAAVIVTRPSMLCRNPHRLVNALTVTTVTQVPTVETDCSWSVENVLELSRRSFQSDTETETANNLGRAR